MTQTPYPCTCDPWAASETCRIHGDEEHRCTCLPYPYGSGPEIDCPVHGEPDPEPGCGQEEGPHFTDCYATPDPWQQGPMPPPPF